MNILYVNFYHVKKLLKDKIDLQAWYLACQLEDFIKRYVYHNLFIIIERKTVSNRHGSIDYFVLCHVKPKYKFWIFSIGKKNIELARVKVSNNNPDGSSVIHISDYHIKQYLVTPFFQKRAAELFENNGIKVSIHSK